jgi:hypothetical protein
MKRVKSQHGLQLTASYRYHDGTPTPARRRCNSPQHWQTVHPVAGGDHKLPGVGTMYTASEYARIPAHMFLGKKVYTTLVFALSAS